MTPSDSLDPIERRIWRLAFLLTGNAHAAAELIHGVTRSRPDPATLEPARLDRLIVLRSREHPAGGEPQMPGAPDDARLALRSALALPPQPLEAWILTRVDELDALHVSRAMDCSRTAAGNHLAAADERMKSRLGPDHDRAVAALRAYADSIDPVPLIAAARRRAAERRRRRLTIVGGVVSIAVLFLAYVVLTLVA